MQVGLSESPGRNAPAKLGWAHHEIPVLTCYDDRLRPVHPQQQERGDPNTEFTSADFHRHPLNGQTFVQDARVRMIAWQIPLGNTSLDDTWDHYRDNRVQWLLGASDRAHLRAYAAARYAGFLFGGGADGTTSAATGYVYAHGRAYDARGPVKLP